MPIPERPATPVTVGQIGAPVVGPVGGLFPNPGPAVDYVLSYPVIDALGDLIVGQSDDTVQRLPIGAEGRLLQVVSGVPSWQPAPPPPAGGGVDYENVWAVGTAYVSGDVVTNGGITYLAVNPSTGQTPPAAAAPVMRSEKGAANGVATLDASSHIPFAQAPPAQIGTSLPASPTDGQVFTLVDSLTTPTYAWRFQYSAGITDAKKWVFIGGAPKRVEIITNEQHPGANGTWQNLATDGPLFSVPRAGDYDGVAYANAAKTKAEAQSAYLGIENGNVGAAVYAIWFDLAANTNDQVSLSFSRRLTGMAANDTIKMRYFAGNNSGTAPFASFFNRTLLVTPARIS